MPRTYSALHRNALSSTVDQIVLCRVASCAGGFLSSAAGPRPLDARIAPSCGSRSCPQALPRVPWGADSPNLLMVSRKVGSWANVECDVRTWIRREPGREEGGQGFGEDVGSVWRSFTAFPLEASGKLKQGREGQVLRGWGGRALTLPVARRGPTCCPPRSLQLCLGGGRAESVALRLNLCCGALS